MCIKNMMNNFPFSSVGEKTVSGIFVRRYNDLKNTIICKDIQVRVASLQHRTILCRTRMPPKSDLTHWFFRCSNQRINQWVGSDSKASKNRKAFEGQQKLILRLLTVRKCPGDSCLSTSIVIWPNSRSKRNWAESWLIGKPDDGVTQYTWRWKIRRRSFSATTGAEDRFSCCVCNNKR